LNCPTGLACHKDRLFICDSDNKRIQILTIDLEYINTIPLVDDTPYIIQISETTICVSCFKGTLVYDLETRILKFKYDSLDNLNYIDSIFYGSNLWEEKFYFFNSDGNLIEEVKFNEKLSKYMTDCPVNWKIVRNSGRLCKIKDTLYMTDYDSSILLKFT
jgi:hypothetical protein